MSVPCMITPSLPLRASCSLQRPRSPLSPPLLWHPPPPPPLVKQPHLHPYPKASHSFLPRPWDNPASTPPSPQPCSSPPLPPCFDVGVASRKGILLSRLCGSFLSTWLRKLLIYSLRLLITSRKNVNGASAFDRLSSMMRIMTVNTSYRTKD